MDGKIYIVIVNYNGWQDTIECIASVLKSEYKNFEIIICDNASENNSVECIKRWLEERSIFCFEYDAENKEWFLFDIEAGIHLIHTGRNGGFAYANNIAIKHAFTKNDFQYIWLLNNDTVIDSAALTYLVEHAREDSEIGMCGSTLLYYDERTRVQAYGGATYNKWFGIARHIGQNKFFDGKREAIDYLAVEKKMCYVVGASMLVSKRMLQEIGLMDEQYFLYNEELDWAMRARKRYRLGYAARSIVYHKEGRSTGGRERSMLSDYYGVRNRILFTKKFLKYELITVYAGLLITLFNRIRRRQFDRVKMLIKIILNT